MLAFAKPILLNFIILLMFMGHSMGDLTPKFFRF